MDVRGQSPNYVALQLTGPALSPVVVTLLPGPESRAFYQDVYHKVESLFPLYAQQVKLELYLLI